LEVIVDDKEYAPCGREIYGWQEYKNLLNRLGIMWDNRVEKVIITLPAREPVQVQYVYECKDAEAD
jgi:hypothetical protein